MMRKLLIVLSLLVMFIFVVSCSPQMTDEEIETELQKLTPEERESLLRDLELEKGTFAGQAIKRYAGVSSNLYKLPKSRVEAAAKRLSCVPKTSAQLCILDQTCGNIPDGCGGVVACGNLCGDLKKPYCSDNRCRPEIWCEDSDGGINFDAKGIMDYGNLTKSIIKTETCISGAQTVASCSGTDCYIFETYCSGLEGKGMIIHCPSCSNGVCPDAEYNPIMVQAVDPQELVIN